MGERAKEDSRFSPSEVGKFMLDITRGVSQLHKRDIIHRDLKSDNIFTVLTRDGDVSRCVVGDFDSAKRTRSQGAANTLVGTPGWMAPEVFTGERYGPACDIWSMGIVLYELITMQRPYGSLPFTFITSPLPTLQIDRARYGPEFAPLIVLFESCTQINPHARPSVNIVLKKLASFFCSV